MAAEVHRQEATNRAFKALCVLNVLDRHGLTSAEMRRLDDAGWTAAVQLAAVENQTEWTEISPYTRTVVAGLADRRERVDQNPFEGFPT